MFYNLRLNKYFNLNLFQTASIKKVLSRNLPVDSGSKVSSIALVLHSSEKELFLCFPGEAKISVKTAVRDASIR